MNKCFEAHISTKLILILSVCHLNISIERPISLLRKNIWLIIINIVESNDFFERTYVVENSSNSHLQKSLPKNQ